MATARRLAADFPSAPLRRAHRRTGEKTYRLGTLPLDAIDSPNAGSYHELAVVLRSTNYRTALERLAGVDLASSTPELNVWEYAGGDWLAPHLDKPDKVVTQIFYLSTDWKPAHGGRLLVFDGTEAPREVAFAYPPIAGSSAILVRSATSWHAVEAPSAQSPPRRSVTATFRRTSPR
jgi:Rps23 Pro-64 3,4-dihydroxylase Tpa1-like proline 4-hydroxylase